MKIVVLDGFTMNPGDLEWNALETLGEFLRESRQKTLARSGVDIESHSFTHPLLTHPGKAMNKKAYQAWIDEELAGRLRRMVGFRNIAVHQYQALDPTILLAIADKHLGDLHIYAARVLDHLGLK